MNALIRILARRTALAVLVVTAMTMAAPAVHADELKDARTALAAGQLDDALKLFERAAAQGYAEGRAGVGQVWLRRRNYEKALEQFEMTQKMDANLAIGYWGVGEVARRNEDYAAALPSFQRAVELDRKFPDAQLGLGDALTQLKKYDEAVAALNPGLNWGTKWRPRFLVALGNVEMARDSLRDAGIYFTQAREAAPDDPITNKALGDFYLRRGIGALAVPEYEKAVALDSTDIDLRFALGRALAFDQRYDEAILQYKAVADQNPEYAGAQLALGDIYYRAGQAKPAYYTEAKPYLDKYTALVPTDVKGWSLLGRTQYFLGQKDDAAVSLQKALEMGDKSKDMYAVLFRLSVDRKEWQKALDAAAKAEPTSQDLVKLAQVYAFMGNLTAADSAYRAIVEKDSLSRDGKFALLEMAKMQYRNKDYPTAAATLQRRIALDGTSDEAYYYLGLCHKEMKQFPEAISALRQAATLAPTKGDRHFWLAVTLTQADSIDAALEEFRATVAVDSTSKNASVARQQLGYRALLKKDWGGAIDNLEKSAAIDPKNVGTLVWLAQAYQNSGNRAKAGEYYRKVLEIQPGHPEAIKGLKLLG
ncbi:MAG: tetratricopeptide repeat protein [Candidatus Eisenbacteria bacterium]|nr:tetratricopeptide repeat protein [Candidatus Eisenbacteria bacterium]